MRRATRRALVLGAVGVGALAGCRSADERDDHARVTFPHDTLVTTADATRRPLAAGSPLDVGSGVAYVEADGAEPAWIVPLGDGATRAAISLPRPPRADREPGGAERNALLEEGNRRATERFRTLLPRFFRAQVLGAAGKKEEALTVVEALRIEFPTVTYLGFFEADLLHALGRSDEALRVVQAALEDFPGDPRGVELLALVKRRAKGGRP